MYTSSRPTSPVLTLLLAFALLPLSCATMRDLAGSQRPALSVKDVRVRRISFEAIDLSVDVKIRNPNPVAVTAVGFDYELSLVDRSFLTGQQDRRMSIASNGESVLAIPVTLNYAKIHSTVRSLKEAAEIPYRISCGVTFDLPLLGTTRIPVSHRGTMPALKMPSLEVTGLNVLRLSFSGAELALRLKLVNPNIFGGSFRNLAYQLDIEGTQWAHGIASDVTEVPESGSAALTIPISLNFSNIGTTVHRALSGPTTLDYRLVGSLDIGLAAPSFQATSVPFDVSGVVDVHP